MIDNPLAQAFALPFRLPPFADVTAAHFSAAFAEGMREQLVEVDMIAGDQNPPTFLNTLVALERSGQLLTRTSDLFFNLVSSCSNDQIRAIEKEFAPRLSAHTDAIRLNTALFGRIEVVVAAVASSAAGTAELTDEDRALVTRYHLDFVLAGARLDASEHRELGDLHERLSRCSTIFGQNLQAATEAAALVLTDESDLAGMSSAEVQGARAEATARGRHGKYLIPLVLPSGQPLLSTLMKREIRQRLFQASVTRAASGEFDNSAVAIEIAQLRAQRARLLGFATHADAVVADQTAGTCAAVDAMLAKLVAPAMAAAQAEAQILAELATADGVELAAWDWAYYSEKVRAQRYCVDTAALRPYFELDRVLQDGVFFAAGQLYGVTFHLRPDLPGYHRDVRVWEVRDSDGSAIGLYLGDYFAREGKRGGAWMNSFVRQSTLLGDKPVVVNNLNVTRAAKGSPTLLTLDEVDTLFHEFGHALHGLFSNVSYPRLSGTSVPRDFVEFPSQVNEMWAMWPQVLANYAIHVETGEPLPAAALEAVMAASQWGQGFRNVEYLAATLLDQAWHRVTPGSQILSASDFESAALQSAGMAMNLLPPRYRTTYFAHIFTGGYSAGYYSYIWAEVLDADTVEWFKENGGMTRLNGEVFRRKLLSKGGSVDSMATFRDVRGRAADLGPLLRRRGLGG